MLNLLQVDDPQKGTDDVPHGDVPVVTAPVVTAPTSDDGTNKNTQHPTVGYYIIYYGISTISIYISSWLTF